jgi:hypothetical protein
MLDLLHPPRIAPESARTLDQPSAADPTASQASAPWWSGQSGGRSPPSGVSMIPSRFPAWAAIRGLPDANDLLVHLLELGTSVAKRRLDWGAFYFRVERGLYAVETSVRLLLSERCVRAPAIGVLVAFGLHALGRRRWIALGWINWAGLAVGACWVSLVLMLWCL